MTVTHLHRAGALALIAATTTALTGCAGVLGATMTYHDSVQTKITDIVLTGGSGDVTVTTAAVTETTITRVIRRSTNPGETYRLVGTTLNIDATCGLDCSVTYEIKAPAGVAVHGRLNSGDIRLDGAGATDLEVTSGDLTVLNGAGPIQLRASSGDIKVLDAKGTVKAQTTSGDIQALNAGGAVDLRLSSGDATVVLTTPASVTAQSTSGDINVTVPTGSYKVSAATSAGDVDLHGMVSNPGAKDVLDVRTGSGDVNVTAAA